MSLKNDINLISNSGVLNYLKLTKAAVIPLVVLVSVLVVVSVFIIPQMRINKLESVVSKQKEEIQSIRGINEKLREYEQKMSDLQNKRDVVGSISAEKIKLNELLKDISSFLPRNVYISQFSMSSPSTYEVSFVISNPVDTARLIVKLNQTEKFDNVEVSSVPINDSESILKLNLTKKGAKIDTKVNTKTNVNQKSKLRNN